jgi:acetoin:2,6-dichlorophenolindophenol oxidoreductase subunit beta
MGELTLADTIREISRRHLEEGNGLLLGQSISAVGWVNNTVPDCKGIIELPMTDVAGAGIAVGAAMVGRRPIFVIRFQDFLVLNGSPLVFYAAKSKELHGRSTPIFVRAIGADGIGPVHSGVLHSLFMHFPGFKVCSPMTPLEYRSIWSEFMRQDSPMIVSEHRASFANTAELADRLFETADITLYPISATRFEAVKAVELLKAEGIRCNVVHILWLKPFRTDERVTGPLRRCGRGLVIDPGYTIAGAAQSIAYELTQATGIPVAALGLLDATKCLCQPFKNDFPNAQRIAATVRNLVGERADPAAKGAIDA